MDDRRAGARGDVVSHGDAPVAIVRRDLYLDQLVCHERAVDFGNQPIGHAGAAYQDARLEAVRTSFEVGAFARGQRIGHARLYAWGAMIRLLLISAVAAGLGWLASIAMWRASQRSIAAAFSLGALFVLLSLAGGIAIAYVVTKAWFGR